MALSPQTPQKMSPKTKHKIELMVIILVITALTNIVVYYLNNKYETGKANSLAKSEEVIKRSTPTTLPTETPIPCKTYTKKTFNVCVPDGWSVTENQMGFTMKPDTVPTDIPFHYIAFSETSLPNTPLPKASFSDYEKITVGTASAYISRYVEKKGTFPITGGCADPEEIFVPTSKNLLLISTCIHYEKDVKPLLDNLTIN